MRKMPCAINWTSRAKLRLRVRQDWIEEESASHEIALAWTARINEEVLAIADFPKLGRIVPEFDREDIREITAHSLDLSLLSLRSLVSLPQKSAYHFKSSFSKIRCHAGEGGRKGIKR